MSVAKVIEISATSTESFDAAVKAGIKKASESVRNIKAAWVKEQRVIVDGGEVKEYQVNLSITFVLD